MVHWTTVGQMRIRDRFVLTLFVPSYTLSDLLLAQNVQNVNFIIQNGIPRFWDDPIYIYNFCKIYRVWDLAKFLS